MPTHPSDLKWSTTPRLYSPNSYTEYRTDGMSAVDWLGNRFHLGEKVMYCIGAGRGQMMAIGTVKQIRAKKVTPYTWGPVTDPEKPWHRERIAGTPAFTEIEVQVLTTKTSGSWDNQARTRPAWVNPMNITAIKEN